MQHAGLQPPLVLFELLIQKLAPACKFFQQLTALLICCSQQVVSIQHNNCCRNTLEQPLNLDHLQVQLHFPIRTRPRFVSSYAVDPGLQRQLGACVNSSLLALEIVGVHVTLVVVTGSTGPPESSYLHPQLLCCCCNVTLQHLLQSLQNCTHSCHELLLTAGYLGGVPDDTIGFLYSNCSSSNLLLK